MNESVSKLISIAREEVGYLEKKSNNDLYNKKANAGTNNYTKYAAELFPTLQAQPWCDMFVDWCFVKAFGNGPAKQLLCGNFNAYTPSSAQYYKNRGQYYNSNPKVGDQIFFRNSVRIYHTGIVSMVTASRVHTIEGNTSDSSEVISNGGGVFEKAYELNNARIDGYGRPDWSIVEKPKYKIGWNKDTNGWYYADTEESYYKNQWAEINNHRYYFNPDGYALTNWHVCPHPETGEPADFYFEPRPNHELECAVYGSDNYGAQIIYTFNK